MQSFKLLTRNNEYSQKIYKIANNYQMPDKDIGFLFKSENNVISLSLFFSIIIIVCGIKLTILCDLDIKKSTKLPIINK